MKALTLAKQPGNAVTKKKKKVQNKNSTCTFYYQPLGLESTRTPWKCLLNPDLPACQLPLLKLREYLLIKSTKRGNFIDNEVSKVIFRSPCQAITVKMDGAGR